MHTAFFAVDLVGSDGESLAFGVKFVNTDGSAYPFDDYTHAYTVYDDGGSEVLSLDESDGITIDAGTGQVDILRLEPGLAVGYYVHRMRRTHVTTEVVEDYFDGSITIGN